MSKRETESVYCIKYALTQGIIKVNGYECDGRFACPDRMHQSFKRTEWARDLETAKELAELMRRCSVNVISHLSIQKTYSPLGSACDSNDFSYTMIRN